MATCDICFSLKHWKCRDTECTCSVCARDKVTKKVTSPRVKAQKPKKPRQPRVARGSTYKPANTPRTLAKEKFGVLTDFSPEQVELIYSRKAEGGPQGTISAIARELGASRDRVRTVYRSTKAPDEGPAYGCSHCVVLQAEILELRAQLSSV